MRIQVFCSVLRYLWGLVLSDTWCLPLHNSSLAQQGLKMMALHSFETWRSPVFMDCLNLKINSLWLSETSVTTSCSAQLESSATPLWEPNIPEIYTELVSLIINLLTPNVDYSGRTAPLTSKCCILYIYSTNIGTDNFKHGIYSPFLPLKNAVCFINLTYLVPVLFTFYIQVC